MLTFVWFHTGVIDGSFPAGVAAAMDAAVRPIATLHAAPTVQPVIDMSFGLDGGTNAAGGFQIGQFIAQAEASQLGKLYPNQPALGDAFLLYDLGWETQNADEMTETAVILRNLAYQAPLGRSESAIAQGLTITSSTDNSRRIDEKPVVRRSDSLRIISDVTSGDNVFRIGLIPLTEEQAMARAGLVPT